MLDACFHLAIRVDFEVQVYLVLHQILKHKSPIEVQVQYEVYRSLKHTSLVMRSDL